MKKQHILLIDDDMSTLGMLSKFFARQGGGACVREESDGLHALQMIQEEIFDVVITDLMLDTVTGIDILKKVKEVAPRTEVIIITGNSSVDTAVQAMKQGAFDYITKPIDLTELNLVVQKAYERQRLVDEVKNLRSQVKEFFRFDNIVATSPAMQKLLDLVRRIAKSNSTVLIEGESGTGKEVIAHALHNYSLRSDGPFVAINCGALPETLLESELFGYVKGAFTGANHTKKGLFEEANGGTIFLDEIGETSPAFQVKLLRVLQENEIRRVGDTRDIAIDVRVLASSNIPIKQLVDEGRFRQDLYFRLKVIPLYIPAIAQRREDIIPLARFFIERYCKRTDRKIVALSKDLIRKMELYDWPGNVRELENAIERAMILVEGDDLTSDDVLLENYDRRETQPYNYSQMSLRDLERRHIEEMLVHCAWNQSEAAKRLNIGYNTLWRKIKQYGLERSAAQ
jgi:two-component system, NtrC family, response regulator AtoC